MHRKHDRAHDERNVNQTGGYVKREKPKQPENNQDCSENRQHVFLSFFVLARNSSIRRSRHALMPLSVRETSSQGTCYEQRRRMSVHM
jgi:hypothetical protein